MREDDEADEDVERDDGHEAEQEAERSSGVESDPFSELDIDGDEDSDPFDELDDVPLGERTPATDDDLFEEMDREELADEDGLVESVLEGEEVGPDADSSGEPASAAGAAVGPESNGSSGSAPPDGTGEEPAPVRDEVVVPKRRYCEGCQYFSDPPETACEHPGTDILELVDTDHFLVADCPVVEWRRELDAYPDPGDSIADPRE